MTTTKKPADLVGAKGYAQLVTLVRRINAIQDKAFDKIPDRTLSADEENLAQKVRRNEWMSIRKATRSAIRRTFALPVKEADVFYDELAYILSELIVGMSPDMDEYYR